MPTDTSMDDYLGDFIQESQEMLENASECLLRLEKSPDDLNEINALFRCLHTIKGSAGFFKLVSISEHAHKAENLLDLVRNKRLALDNKIVDVIFATLDFIGTLFERCAQGEELTANEDLLQRIAKLTPVAACPASANEMKLGEILVQQGAATKEDIDQALQCQKNSAKPGSAASVKGAATIRVGEDKIMAMGNLSGELLVARNTYEYILEQIADGQLSSAATLKLLTDNLHAWARLVNDVHNNVMTMSMVPVKGVFQKFGRVVRDIANKQGKKIDFILAGEDTEVDKRVGDMLSDPLIHLIRNSCDHGLENIAERKAAGKPETGQLMLQASHQGTDLMIEIIDDGKGVDRQKILAKAREQGLDIDENDDDAVLGLIFVAGLSTNDQATDLSGRGVGMDVVMTCINSLQGRVEITSESGVGTHVRMIIPMSMGVNTVLLVGVGGAEYALPFEQVQEVIRIKPGGINSIKDNDFIHYRGQVIGLKSLRQLLKPATAAQNRYNIINNEIPVVIINNGHGVSGVAVDCFIRNMETAIKPLPDSLADNAFANGVCVMGNGKLVLVLNGERF